MPVHGLPGFGGGFAGNVGRRADTTPSTPSNVDSLFDTRPAPAPAAPPPPTVSASFKAQLVSRIQDIWQQTPYSSPKLLDHGKVTQLRQAVTDGQAVEIKLTSTTSAVLKKTDNLEDATSFFVKRTAGFAGTQFFGPFDV